MKLTLALPRRRLLSTPLFVLLLTALFATPALAAPREGHTESHARTWNAYIGAQTSDYFMDVMDYLPGNLTIDAGDTVVWRVKTGEIHTVTFLAAGQQYPNFNPGDPTQLFHQGGSVYDGVSYYNSGVMTTLPEASGFGFAAQTYSLTFPTPGDYTYYCLVHPGMVGHIHVQPAGTRYPHTQAWYDRQNGKTVDTFFSQGYALAHQAEQMSDNHHVMVGAGNMDVDVMRFFSHSVTIKVGQSVSFSNMSMGPHTVTFGPEENIFVPYGNPATYDGSYPLNSGLLLGPAPFTVTFIKPGVYPYFCGLHDYLGMTGTVTVSD